MRLKFRHRGKRLKRSFSTNRYFEKVKQGRLKGFLRREFHSALLPFIQNPHLFFDPDKANLLKADYRTTVAEGEISTGHTAGRLPDGKEIIKVVFKRYNQKGKIDLIKDIFRHSRAFRAWKMANALFYSGFPVALPIGVFEERRLGFLRHSYFVMEKLEGERLNEFLQEGFRPTRASGRSLTGDKTKEKRIALGALARLVRRLHNQGFTHRDLKPTNIFVSKSAEKNLTFYIIDYGTYRLKRRVSPGLRRRDLSRMELAASKLDILSRTERMRFLKEYLAHIRPTKLEFKAWCRDIIRRAEKKSRGERPRSPVHRSSFIVQRSTTNGRRRRHRILIVKPSSIGDVIHSLPVLSELRANFPNSFIAWLVARPVLEIVQDNPHLDEVFVFERVHWGRLRDFPMAWGELVGLIRDIRRKRFDLVIDLQGLFRSGLLSWASGAKMRVGFADGREMSHIFYTHRIDPREHRHIVEQYLALVRSLGVEAKPLEFKIVIPEHTRYRVSQLVKDACLGEAEILAVLAPGAGWPTKRWGGRRYALLAKALKEKYHASVVLVGSASEVPLTRDIEREAGSPMINLTGKINLKELAALLEMADFCVAGDTAALHLAAALNTPTVGIFGPTDPARSGPRGTLHRVVYAGVPCSPCFSRKCKDLRCLKVISVEDVLERIEKIAREMRWPIS